MSEPLNIVCCTIPKNTREEVRVGLQEYKGTQYVDLRIYADLGDGERRPTKQGFTVSFDKLPLLLEGVKAAYAQADRLGLL